MFVADVLRIDDGIITFPDELLRTDLLVSVVLIFPAKRKCSIDDACPISSFNLVLGFAGLEVFQRWGIILPSLASTEGAA